jgi:hypothetical protein
MEPLVPLSMERPGWAIGKANYLNSSGDIAVKTTLILISLWLQRKSDPEDEEYRHPGSTAA